MPNFGSAELIVLLVFLVVVVAIVISVRRAVRSRSSVTESAGFTPKATSAPKVNENEFRARLRQNLVDHFSEDELRTLCFDIGVDYESLAGQGKAGKARELVALVERDGSTARLIEECCLLRPREQWEDPPAAA